jgi:iron complex outermembrane receptor protein/vitamin B12 transporter
MSSTKRAFLAMIAAIAWCGPVWAQNSGTITGTVVDATDLPVPGVTVSLLVDERAVAQTTTNREGQFSFTALAAGRYAVAAALTGFETRTSDRVNVAADAGVSVDLKLQVAPLHETIIETIDSLPVADTPRVAVVNRATLNALNSPDVSEAIALAPGTQIVQVGQRGGLTSLFVRGGNSTFTKVLLDGIPVNDIGGGFDFGQVDTAGVDRIALVRGTDAFYYAGDALAGVVNITTRRGYARTPEIEYAVDGGNLSTARTSLAGGGLARHVDYFSQYSYITTDNETPNSGYHRGTYAGRFGVALGGARVSGTLRRVDGRFESADAFDLFRVADDSTRDVESTFASIAFNAPLGHDVTTTARFGSLDQTSRSANPSPTGEPFDPFGFGPNYLGQTVTLRGANGAAVTGRGILDYGGMYPSVFDNRTTRRTLAGEAGYYGRSRLFVWGGARYEREESYDDPDADPAATRNNGGAFVEAGFVLGAVSIIGGSGIEHNAVFKTAATPHVSVSFSPFGRSLGPKLTVNAGKGIKAPSVFQEQNALYALVQGTPQAVLVPELGPERSRNIDVGVEQNIGIVQVRFSYFHNRFDDLLEYLNRTALTVAGVPPAAAAAAPFGAYVNSSSFSAQGIETSVEAGLGSYVRVNGSYTHLDAEVTKALSASAATNPTLPGVPIGAFSPLVGARPFRRPANSGTLFVSYTRAKAQVALAGYFSGRRDDSTFLSDQFFGNTLLLPNTDLDPAYQKIDLSGGYYVHPRVRVYTTIENLFDKTFDAAFGYPSLPFTIRAGASITIGGDR